MEDFNLYLKLGLYHVLDWQAYDHILFLIALAVIYNYNNWKKVIWLVTLFTIGHTLALGLAAYKIINIDVVIIEFLIPVTIFITAFVNILTIKKGKQKSSNINLIFAFFFGLIALTNIMLISSSSLVKSVLEIPPTILIGSSDL